jgi:3D (Asp-Asp-Asp) domain-containing protein
MKYSGGFKKTILAKEDLVLNRKIFIAIACFVFLIATANSSLTQQDVVILPKAKAVKMTLVITAYYKPLPGQKKYAKGSYKGDIRLNGTGRTFFEEEASEEIAAADFAVLPKGTLVGVPGHKVVKVGDTGGDIKGERLDIFMGSGEQALEKALKWGKKTIKTDILKWGGQ